MFVVRAKGQTHAVGRGEGERGSVLHVREKERTREREEQVVGARRHEGQGINQSASDLLSSTSFLTLMVCTTYYTSTAVTFAIGNATSE